MSQLAGLRIFIVEDEFLLALSLEEDLLAAGCTVLGPFPRLGLALDAARREAFDLAILDVNLNGEFVYPLADELLARGQPFLLLTGYGAADLPERLRTLPRVAKPYEPSALLREVARVAPGRA